MTLLVTGSARVDAGKTTFSTGLVAETSAVGFKPRAGNDYWFDHDDYLDALSHGTLHGKDAKQLAGASPGSLDPSDINPVHRLWQPIPAGSGILGQDGREFLLDRVGNEYVINGTADIPESVRERLPISGSLVVNDIGELNQAMQRHHLQALNALSQTIRTTDRAVVESYSDIARPISGIEPDAVAVVEPARVRMFDGPRFGKACAVASGTEGSFHGQLEERVSAVIDLADPETTLELPALSSEERSDPDAIAHAYDSAYESLLDVAGWR